MIDNLNNYANSTWVDIELLNTLLLKLESIVKETWSVFLCGQVKGFPKWRPLPMVVERRLDLICLWWLHRGGDCNDLVPWSSLLCLRVRIFWFFSIMYITSFTGSDLLATGVDGGGRCLIVSVEDVWCTHQITLNITKLGCLVPQADPPYRRCGMGLH